MCWWLAYAYAHFVLMVLTEAREWTMLAIPPGYMTQQGISTEGGSHE